MLSYCTHDRIEVVSLVDCYSTEYAGPFQIFSFNTDEDRTGKGNVAYEILLISLWQLACRRLGLLIYHQFA